MYMCIIISYRNAFRKTILHITIYNFKKSSVLDSIFHCKKIYNVYNISRVLREPYKTRCMYINKTLSECNTVFKVDLYHIDMSLYKYINSFS